MAPIFAVVAPPPVRFPVALLRRSLDTPVRLASRGWDRAGMVSSHLCEREAPLPLALDWKKLNVREAASEEELLAAVQLRIGVFEN